MVTSLIRLQDIRKSYRIADSEIPVLHGITLDIKKGEIVSLVGISGSGKSTLMNIIGCLDRATKGEYWLENKTVSSLSRNELARIRNEKIGFIFQNFNLLRRTSALDNVILPLRYSPKILNIKEEKQRATELLVRLGLGDRLEHDPTQLSGGQQQRVSIARALINKPSILLADEPTGNLDTHTTTEIMNLFQEINATEGITILLVTHEKRIAEHAHRMIRIEDGVIVGTN